MDKKRSFLNIFFSILFKIIIMFLVLYNRKFIIKYLGNELNGLTSLYTSVVGVLCVVELGIGSAISFSMYKPIIDGDTNKVNALYNLYKKLYAIVGLIILALGLILTPFLPIIAKDYTVDKAELYVGFILYLFSVVLVYFYSAKISLINAHKNNYVTAIITSGSQVLLYIIQIISLIIWQNFIIFIAVRIFTTLLSWMILTIYTRKYYKEILIGNNKLDEEERKNINKNVQAMFFHKIGAELVNTSDNIIISIFLGVTVLGYYSNYSTLCVSMMSLLTLVFSSLTSIIGHFYASKKSTEIVKYYNFFHTLNFVIGLVFFMCFYGTINIFINVFYDATGSLLLERNIVIVITINYFIQYFRKATLTFRDATGTFYDDRYVPIVEGIINIILSIAFVYLFDLAGIIIATIITNLLICYVFEPLILYKKAFNLSSKKFFIKNYAYTVIFVIAILLYDCIDLVPNQNTIASFILNGLYAASISFVIICFIFVIDKNFRNFVFGFLKKRHKR